MQLQLDPNKTYAIALEGGGARGAYEIGVWKALKEAGIRFDAVAGTSVGALNGAMMAVGNLEKAVACWENIRLSQVIRLTPEEETRLGNLLKGKTDPGESLSFQDLQESLMQISGIVRNRGLDITPLRSWIAQIIDTAGLKESPVELYVTTVNLSDKKTQEIRIRDVPEEQICDMLMASAYHPTFRQEKLGGKYYADGGFFDTLPLHALTASGHKDIIAVRLPSAGMERIFRLPPDVKVTTVKSRVDLGGVLNFTAEQARFDLKVGYFDGLRMLYGLKGDKYYIDAVMSEEEALTALAERRLFKGRSKGLCRFMEIELPAKALSMGVLDKSYRNYLLAFLEKEAAAKKIDPYQILTDRELLELLTK